MISRNAKVNSPIGLCSRPAMFFIQKATTFKDTVIWIQKDEDRMNAKSLMGVLYLKATSGAEITVIADGPEENEAVSTLCDLLENGLNNL